MNIKDIACAANVSVSTVSKVLNGKDSDISEATRRNVLQIAREYQYTPYSNLKDNIALTRSNTLALILHGYPSASPFIYSIERTASYSGYSLVICNLGGEPFKDLKKYLDILQKRKIEGIILCTDSEELVEKASCHIEKQLPFLVIGAAVPPVACPVFQYDYKSISFSAVELLIQQGHTNIGCLLDASSQYRHQMYLNGYSRALFEHSLFKSEQNILTYDAYSKIQDTDLQSLLEQGVTAIFCQTCALATLVYQFLLKNGYYIPQDISIVCGECPESSFYLHPALTSYHIPYDKLGQAAMEYLAGQIENKRENTSELLHFEPDFSSGHSVCSPSENGNNILVIGNCNIDIMIQTSHQPVIGDIINANSIVTTPGGKCLDQAIGARKLGSNVYTIGRIGDDSEGHSVLSSLTAEAVHTDGIISDRSAATGKAYINIISDGSSSIISYPGANRFLDSKQLKRFKHLFFNAHYCLLSTEVSQEVVAYTLNECSKQNIEVFVKPSAILSIDQDLLHKITYFVPNEIELNQLLPSQESIVEKADFFFHKGCRNVIVTLGSRGCYLKNKDYSLFIPAANFTAVDNTGAANCFISAMAVSLGRGDSLLYAICYATYAAGLSVTQSGVHVSFPYKKQVDLYLDDIAEMYSSLMEAGN